MLSGGTLDGAGGLAGISNIDRPEPGCGFVIGGRPGGSEVKSILG